MLLPVNKNAPQISFGIHVIRNYYGNPNRGENGEPKTVAYGSSERMRCSTASMNYDIRQTIRKHLPNWMGVRTAKPVEMIKYHGPAFFPDQEELNCIAGTVGMAFRGKDESNNKNDPDKTQIIHLSDPETILILEYLSELKNNNQKEFAIFKDPLAAIDDQYITTIHACEALTEEDREKLITLGINRLFTKAKIKSLKLDPANFPDDVASCKEEHIVALVNKAAELANDEEDRKEFEKIVKCKKDDSESTSKGTLKKIRAILEKLSLRGQHPLECLLWGRNSMSMAKTIPNISGNFTCGGAYGIHQFAMSEDFFTCIDDLRGEDQGAAHTGIKYVHNTLAYEYYSLAVTNMLENLPIGVEPEKCIQEITPVLIDAIFNLQLHGNRKMGNNLHPPHVMLIEVRRDNYPHNHLSAFSNALNVDNEIVTRSIIRLLGHAKDLYAAARKNNLHKAFVSFLSTENHNKLAGNPFELTPFNEIATKVTDTVLALLKEGKEQK